MKAETLLPLGKLDPGLAQPDATGRLGHRARSAHGGRSRLPRPPHGGDQRRPLPRACRCSHETDSVHIGTSVSIAFARSPFVTAMTAWTMQKLANGRFELGLGSQVGAHIRRRFGLPSHPAVRGCAITSMRSSLFGEAGKPSLESILKATLPP